MKAQQGAKSLNKPDGYQEWQKSSSHAAPGRAPLKQRHRDLSLMLGVPISRDGAFIQGFQSLSEAAHKNSRSKGFWDTIESLKDHPRWAEIEVIWKLSRIALFHSEASEACEGIRKGLPDDHLPHRSMEVAELADIIIRIMDYAGAYNLPMAEVILEKMEYNASRPFMHGDKKA